MSKSKHLLLASLIVLMANTVGAQEESSPAQLRQQVEDTERAFAATMADRDYAAFTQFLSDEAVFFSGDKLRCAESRKLKPHGNPISTARKHRLPGRPKGLKYWIQAPSR